MRYAGLLIILAILMAVGGYAQGVGSMKRVTRSAKAVKPQVGRSPAEAFSQEIHYARPDLRFDTIFRDVRAVEASLPAIKYLFSQRGFDKREAENATLFAWKQLRTSSLEPTVELSPTVLINFVNGLGKLVITSSPTEASVELDGKALDDPTDTVAWASDGTHQIRLSKPGFKTISDACVVKEGKLTEYHKELPPEK